MTHKLLIVFTLACLLSMTIKADVGTSGDDTFEYRPGLLVLGAGGYDTLIVNSPKASVDVATIGEFTRLKSVYESNTDYFGIIAGVEEIRFEDQTLKLEGGDRGDLNLLRYNKSHELHGTEHDEYVLLDTSRIVDGEGGYDQLLVFAPRTAFTIESIGGLTFLVRNQELFTQYREFDRSILEQIDVIHFLDETVVLEAPDRDYQPSEFVMNLGASDDFVFKFNSYRFLNGGAGYDTYILFEDSTDFSIQTLTGITQLISLENRSNITWLTGFERMQFRDREVQLETTPLNTIVSDDDVVGTEEDDVIHGSSDTINVDAANGRDTLVYFAPAADFDVSTLSGLTRITPEPASRTGLFYRERTVRNVELLQFTDAVVPIEDASAIEPITRDDSPDLLGTPADDYLDFGVFTYTADGGNGLDTLLLFEDSSNFDVTTIDGFTRLVHRTRYSRITLVSIERVEFSDGVVLELATSDDELLVDKRAASEQRLNGSSRGDLISVKRGGGLVDGKAGTDALVIFESSSDFDITSLAGVTRLTYTGSGLSGYSGVYSLINVEELHFADTRVTLDTDEGSYVFGAFDDLDMIEGTRGNDIIDGLGGSDDVYGRAGDDTYLVFGPSSQFAVNTLFGITVLENLAPEGRIIEPLGERTLLVGVEQIRFLDKIVQLNTSEINPILYSDGTAEDEYFDNRKTPTRVDGNEGFDTYLIFNRSDYFEIVTEDTLTTIQPLESALSLVSKAYQRTITLENFERIQFLDKEVLLGGIEKDPTAFAFMMTSPESVNHSELHIINSSDEPQMFVGSLYNREGQPMGASSETLHLDPVLPHGRIILSSQDLSVLFGGVTWQGPAILEVMGQHRFELMSKLKGQSGLVSNSNCVRNDAAHNVEGLDSSRENYIRLVNIGNGTLINQLGTLYDSSGAIIGETSVELFESLRAKEGIWLSTHRLQSIFGQVWEGTATLALIAPSSNLRVLNLNREKNGTFFNFSCHQPESEGFAFLQTSEDSPNITETHLINVSEQNADFKGTLFNSNGEQLGKADTNLIKDLAPNGRFVTTSDLLASQFNVSPWEKPALLEVKSSSSFRVMSKLTSKSGLTSNSNCTRKYTVHNVEGTDSNIKTYIRAINVGDGDARQITARLYSADGSRIGKLDFNLPNLAPREAVWLNNKDIERTLDVTWQGAATLAFDSPQIEDLRFLNLNQVNGETFFNFSCYENSDIPPAISSKPANQYMIVGEEFELDVSGVFEEAASELTITVAGLPPGFTFDGQTISGSVSNPGNYQISLIATDRFLNRTESTFLIAATDSTSLNVWKPLVYYDASNYVSSCESPRQGIDPRSGNFYPDVQGSAADENFWLRSWSNDLYLWYDEIADRDPSLYETAAYFQLLKTQRPNEQGQQKDRFHFSLSTEDWFNQSLSGINIGYGATFVVLQQTPPRQIVIAYTEPGSPADLAGITRGMEVLEVDSVDLVSGRDVATLNSGLFPTESGEIHAFKFRSQGTNNVLSVQMTSGEVVASPVQSVSTHRSGSRTVGYFLFNDHSAPAESQLIDAIAELKRADIDDLVLDLRYNSGGYLHLASELAYMIAGSERTSGLTFERLQFNEKHPVTNPVTGEPNTPVGFIDTAVGFSAPEGSALPVLNLDRVFILTGAGTCSASEAIINGLRGVDIEVIQIGKPTCGKPYGFYAQHNCGTSYFSIQFKGVNNKGYGDYNQGFSPKTVPVEPHQVTGCNVADDFSRELGDPEEARFSAALYYQSTGSCPSTSNARPKVGQDEPLLIKGEFFSNRILAIP